MKDKLGNILVDGDIMVYPEQSIEKLHGIVNGEYITFIHKGNKDGSLPLKHMLEKMVKYNSSPIIVVSRTNAAIEWSGAVTISSAQKPVVEFLSDVCESCSA